MRVRDMLTQSHDTAKGQITAACSHVGRTCMLQTKSLSLPKLCYNQNSVITKTVLVPQTQACRMHTLYARLTTVGSHCSEGAYAAP